ncbi:MAG: HAMP domain-containing protein, partial [Thermodesulfobacteriota bacterium]|nr:HAMP domain-containing protein [Thermodesulfobacteriota bacterium]
IGVKALEMAAVFSKVPDVLTAYRLALLGDLEDENDHEMQMAREHLRKVMAPYIDGYLGASGKEQLKVHFHTPNGRSLVRLWRDGWQAKRNGEKVDISDDLTSFRQTVVDINASEGGHKPLSGIEVGRGGFAIRGLAPITARDGNHVGSVELLLPFIDAIDMNVNEASNYDIATYMVAEKLPVATKLQDPEKNPVLDNKYVFVSSSDKTITTPVITSAMLDAGRDQSYSQFSGDHYILTAPIYNYSHKVAGVMAVVFDLTQTNAIKADMIASGERAVQRVNWQFGGGAAVVVLIIIAVLFYVTRLVVGPLKNTIVVAQKVAEGDLSQSVQYQSKDEVGELAVAINTMVESLKVKAE